MAWTVFVRWCRCPSGSQSCSRFSCSQSQMAVQKWVFHWQESLPVMVNKKFTSQIIVVSLIDDFRRLVPCTQGVSQQQLGLRFSPATVGSMLATQLFFYCMMGRRYRTCFMIVLRTWPIRLDGARLIKMHAMSTRLRKETSLALQPQSGFPDYRCSGLQ